MELKKFIVLHPYLKTIAKFTGLPAFSHEVSEAYWLGNDQLKKAKLKDYNLLLENFALHGVPDFLIQELASKKPRAFIPTHLFQVLHVGVGRASGSVPFNLETINNCMIRWGKVKSLTASQATIDLHLLAKVKKGYKLVGSTISFPAAIKLVPNIKAGNTVAVHWKQLIKILTEEEEKKLDYWTNEVMADFTA